MGRPCRAASGSYRIGVSLCTPFFVMAFGSDHVLAQAGCPNDGTLTFPTEVAGVVTLNDVRVGEITTGGNNPDLAQQLTLAGPQPALAQGNRLVSAIDINEFPDDASALQPGFTRRVNRFFEVNYTRGQYQFANRADLNVQVTFSIPGDSANSTIPSSSSSVAVTPQLDNLQVNWFGGRGNSLRRLRGRVIFSYSELERLQQAGVHRADLTVCVEVSGFQ